MMLTSLSFALLLGQSTTLWQIGEVNQSGAEFGLAPNRYRSYTNDPTYIVGTSRTDAWLYVLPGPDDSWAGSRPHRSTVFFSLGGPKTDCRLVCDFVETHYGAPPRLSLWINGRKISQWQAPAGRSDEAIDGRPDRGRHAVWRTAIPAKTLSDGVNELQIRNDRGSWVVFDALRFEGSPSQQVGVVPPGFRVQTVGQPQVVLRTPQGPRQIVDLEVTNFGAPGNLEISGGATWSGHIETGSQTVPVQVPRVPKTQTVDLKLQVGTQVHPVRVQVAPVRQWTVFLLPHSHVDIGYTDYQPIVAAMHRRNLFDAMAVDRETAAFPSNARYRFNAEATWIFDLLELDGTPAQTRQVADAIRAGTIDCSAGYCNTLTALMRPEELVRSYAHALTLKQRLGITLATATQTDVPGATWGDVAALSQAGVRNLVLMPNPSDRVGGVLTAWQDKPFYWVSPSGKERVLVWETASYGVAHGLRRFNGDRTKLFRTADPTKNFIDAYIFRRLEELARQGYPYDYLAFPWSGTDNFPVDADVPYAVKHWNETYVVPRVVTSTVTQACDALTAKYRGKIPTVRGDFTPYWEDGAGSSARETAMNRASADRLIQAETLYAMNRGNYDPAGFWHAWSDVILYSEHTWGAYNSISEPDAPSVKQQWEYKRNFAVQADRLSRDLLRGAVVNPAGSQFSVVNTTSWSRSDLVLLSPQDSQGLDRVVDERGRPVPSQRLKTGELAVLARNVPAFGSVRMRLMPGKPWHERSVYAGGNRLAGPDWRIELDPKAGGIRSLRSLELNRELARAGATPVAQYLYLLRTDLRGLQRGAVRSIQVVEPGPLVAEIRLTLQAPGTRSLTQDIRLVAGLDRIDIINHLDKAKVREKEGVHFAFPFQVPNGQVRIHGPWAVIRPDLDQIAGSNKNWFNTQYFVDVSNNDYGVTWTSVDAPLMEVGGITANLLGGVYDSKEWLHRIGPTQTIYSWALNNHWHTNYRADQEGPLTFRYSIRAHRPYAPDEAYRFGVGVAQPLLVTSPQSTAPLLTVSNPRVVVTSLKPSNDGKALIVRLWCVGDRPAKVALRWRQGLVSAQWLSDSGERSIRLLSGPLPMAGWQVVTLRAALTARR